MEDLRVLKEKVKEMKRKLRALRATNQQLRRALAQERRRDRVEVGLEDPDAPGWSDVEREVLSSFIGAVKSR
jgi:hypothetical protein